MNLIFAGTPEFAAVALRAIHAAGFPVVLALTQPDRPAGRGMQLQASPVKQFALQHQIPLAQPVSLRLDGKHPVAAREVDALLRATPHDVMIVAAYGLILPPSVLAIAPHGCLNIHASLLPRWRGAAPIHRAIEAGDADTGITIMQMDQGLDTGPMISATRLAILPDDTTGSLHDRLAALGGTMIVEALHRLAAGDLIAEAQPHEGVTYAAKVSKPEALLDFTLPARLLEQKIRAFNPAPTASALINGSVIKIWAAQCVDLTTDYSPGQIVSADEMNGLIIACGDGGLRLSELQKPGGKRLRAREFLQGFPLTAGSVTTMATTSPAGL